VSGLFWADGQFRWWFVTTVAFIAIALVAIDAGWRLVVMPFERFAALAIGCTAACAVVVWLIGRWARR
jgi:hypothetical protein